MEGHDAINEGLGEAFDALSDLFFDSSAQVMLLKASQDTEREFDVVQVITDKRFFHSAAGILYVADSGVNITDAIAESTHVQIGEQVYVIIPDDTTAPDAVGGTRFKWNIRLEKFTRQSQFAPVY